jgi:hypothetical protein
VFQKNKKARMEAVGLRGWWLGKRSFIIAFFIIANCTLIDLTRSSLCRLQLTRQAAFMTTFFVYYSWMLTVKHRL